MDRSENGRYLYTVIIGKGTISTVCAGPDGSLSEIWSIAGLPSGINGLADRCRSTYSCDKVSALDFSLRHRVIRLATRVAHAVLIEPEVEFAPSSEHSDNWTFLERSIRRGFEMTRVTKAIVLSGVLAVPVFAQDGSMTTTCAEFMAMNSEGQMMTLKEMQTAAKDMASDKMMAEDSMATDDSIMAEDSMATDDSMMAEDSMATDDSMMAEDSMATDDSIMAEDSMAADDSMMAEDSMAAQHSMVAEDMVSRVLQSCEGDPDMMVMDAMMEASGN
jgi:hypothetical protein